MKIPINYKIASLAAVGSIFSVPVMAADTKEIAQASYIDWVFENIILLSGAAIVLLACISLYKVIILLSNYNLHGFKDAKLTYDPDKVSVFSKFYSYLIGLKPMSSEQDIALDHDYDGIKELDNSLPPWWLYTFYFTILVGVGYLYVYEFSDIGQSQEQEYIAEMELAEDQQRAFLAAQANAVDESNVVLLHDEKAINDGMLVYKGNCAVCHGQLGEGGVGPNLTDDYWIHGNSTAAVFKTIKYGVPERGMISWKQRLSPVTIQKLTSYIATLQGTAPPNGKSPQGEFMEPNEGKTLSYIQSN